MSKAIVVIPVYREDLSALERISLIQCCKVLQQHSFCLVCPVDLNIDKHIEIFKTYKVDYRIERFQVHFFAGLDGYNRLMLNDDFYRSFIDNEYILIYQLDAFVFKDELTYWCEKGYDYIGAPWFEGFNLATSKSKMLDVSGNGGFSLRRVKSFINLLGSECVKNKYIPEYLSSGQYEDMFFSKRAVEINENFKVSEPKVAMYFSFECLPNKLYKMTNKNLPFGCHAWEKYDPVFWSKFININASTLMKLYLKSRRVQLESKLKLAINRLKSI